MKHLSQNLLTALIAFFLFGCSMDDDSDTLLNGIDNQNIGFGLIHIGQTDEVSFTVKLDDGTILYPVNDFSTESLENGDRVLINYNITGPTGFGDKIYKVQVNSLTKLLYKGILDITAEMEDSIGHDPIHVEEVWAMGNMLTFQLNFYGNDKSHIVNLVKQPGDAFEEDRPVQLELRHNDNDDKQNILLTAFVTFDLSSIKIEGQKSVLFVVTCKDYDGKTFRYSGIYNY